MGPLPGLANDAYEPGFCVAEQKLCSLIGQGMEKGELVFYKHILKRRRVKEL